MNSNQERIYQASQIIEGVAACLLDYASCYQQIELFDVMELVGRLDLAVEAIRYGNGAEG